MPTESSQETDLPGVGSSECLSQRDLLQDQLIDSRDTQIAYAPTNAKKFTRDKKTPVWMQDFVSLNIQEVPYAMSNNLSYENLSTAYKAYLAYISAEVEPKSYSEAAADPKWIQAIQTEIEALHGNHTWDIVSLPKGKVPLRCKWVYKIKYKSTGEVERYKARLVSKEYSPKDDIDYQGTFSPVVKMKIVRTILSLVAQNNWHIHQMDVFNAFLQRDLNKEICMELPQGFKSQGEHNTAYRLMKFLYGLKQTPRQWNAKLSQALLKFQFKQSEYDQSMFIKKTSNGMDVVLEYVDDMLIT